MQFGWACDVGAWIVRGLIFVSAISAVIFGYTAWRNSLLSDGRVAGKAEVQKLWDDETRQRQAVAITAGENFRKQERLDARRVSENEIETRKNEKVAAAAVARTAAVNRGLLGRIAALDAAARSRGLPTAASCASEFERERDAAILSRGLLGQCSTRYREVAGAADGLGLKLSSAMSYIDVVKPVAFDTETFIPLGVPPAERP